MARKTRKQSQNEFERHGMRVEQVGKSIEWSSHRTPEEHATFKQELWKSRPQIVASIRAAVQELSELMQKYTSFDLVANLWLKNGIFNPETYREWDAPQRPHHIEYATLLEILANLLARDAGMQ